MSEFARSRAAARYPRSLFKETPTVPITRRAAAMFPWALWAGLAGTAQAQGGHQPGRSLVISLSLEPDSLDPTMAPSATIGQVVHGNVLEGLVKIEEGGAVSPLLAQSWKMEPDGKTYTFQLRRGVRFHDGAAFDAQAVKHSFERAKAAGSANKSKKALFDNIASIATPDAHTVILTLNNADGDTLFRLGESPAVILHPASAAQAATRPVGTGPYRLEEWRKGWGITLVRASSYRRAAQVAIGAVTFRFISDPDEQSAAVLKGEVDMFFNIATQNVSRFQADNRYQVLIGASSGKGMLALNHRRQPFQDVRVRRAVMHAIDREAFIQQVLQGRGSAIGSHFSPTDAGYLNLTGVYPYDPDKARALLKEAAQAAPLPSSLTLTLPPTPYARNGGPFIAQALARVGLTVRLEPVDWAQWLSGTFHGQFDMSIINHVEPLDYQIYADPRYYFGYDSAAFRALVARHGASTNARERRTMFLQMQRHLTEDAVNAWIFAPQVSTVVRKGLQGVWMNYPIFAHDVAAMRWG